MSSFGVLRNIVKVAGREGYPKESLQKAAEGSLFTDSESRFFKQIGKSLQDQEKRERLFSIFGANETDPFPLNEVLKTGVRFSNIKHDAGASLTATEVDFLNLSIAFLEEWFFRGNWTSVPKDRDTHPQKYAYFSLPAGILNALTKFKEMPRNKESIRSIDTKKLTTLLENALQHARDEYTGVVSDKALEGLEASYKRVRNEIGEGGNLAGDLYFLKTCMVAAHMSLDHDQDEDPLWASVKGGRQNEYLTYDFSGGEESQFNSLHYPSDRIAFALAVVDYLKNKRGA